MRLSDIKGDRVFDVIADIIDPIANIAEGDAAAALFRREKLPDGIEPKKFLLGKVRKSLPDLLKGHKGDIITILAAIQGVSNEDYSASLTLTKLATDCIELLNDDAFTELFISAQSETPSGSAQESTEAQEA